MLIFAAYIAQNSFNSYQTINFKINEKKIILIILTTEKMHIILTTISALIYNKLFCELSFTSDRGLCSIEQGDNDTTQICAHWSVFIVNKKKATTTTSTTKSIGGIHYERKPDAYWPWAKSQLTHFYKATKMIF